MKQSNFLSLNWLDLGKGLLMAILVPALVIVQQSLEAEVLTFNWKAIGVASIAGGVSYLLKNLFTFPKEVNNIVGGSTPPPNKDEK